MDIPPITEHEQKLWDQVSAAQAKHAYFKITAALSAIAFTVHITRGESLVWEQAPFGIAVLAWAASAYCGFKAIGNTTLITMLNAENMASNRGVTSILRGPARDRLHETTPAEREVRLRERADHLNIINAKLFDWNWGLLLFGGAAFIVGQVVDMAAN
jgi:hypothetical protein